MSDKIRVLLVDDENKSIGHPVMTPEEIDLRLVRSWKEAQEVLSELNEPLEVQSKGVEIENR
jgi:hypothetical protein